VYTLKHFTMLSLHSYVGENNDVPLKLLCSALKM